jgi:hypothetical protein
MFYDPDLGYTASGFDESVLSLAENTRIEGLFQSEEYFFSDPDRVRQYIRIAPKALDAVAMPEDMCVLNVRGGEYKRHRRLILPRSYWIDGMRNMTRARGIDQFMVVTDDPRYARSLFPGVPVLQGGIAECYLAIYLARFAILSNSSFAYFPVKTSQNKDIVIAPMHWARFGNPYGRWASPANLYSDWVWQDRNGELHTHTDCVRGQHETVDYYRERYNVQVPPSVVNPGGLRRFFPAGFRRGVKTALSLVFPRHFG